jgi:outer membrane protein TolC
LDFDWTTRSNTGRIDLELPLDRKAERNDYRRATIVLQRSLRETQRKRNNVMAEVRNAFRDVQDARQSYEIQVTSLKLAERRVRNIIMLFAAGRTGINIRDQLDAEDDLRTARNAVTNQLVNYTIARLEFYNAIEALEIDEKGNWHEND